jgi:hypothetical protein
MTVHNLHLLVHSRAWFCTVCFFGLSHAYAFRTGITKYTIQRVFGAICSKYELLAAEGPGQLYCKRLETQNDGEATVAIIVILGQVVGFLLTVMGLCLCTAGFASCCCCARETWCSHFATPCSKGCYVLWGNLLSRCGCGWCDPRLNPYEPA